MKRFFLLLLLAGAAGTLWFVTPHGLERDLCRAVRGVDAEVGIAVVREGRVIASVGGDRPMPAMSTFKFPLALAVATRLDSLGLPLSTQLEVTGDDLWPDTWSPLREVCPAGGEFTVAELLAYSVAQSDNNVCDLLFRFLGGPETVSRYVARLGVGETEIVADEETMHRHTDNQYLNRTTPLAAVRLLERFRRGELLPDEYGDFLERTMFATTTGPDKLRGLLPAGVAVAHKTGSSDRTASGVKIADNDIGFVRLPDGREYSIAVFVMDSREDDRTNAAVIARISRLVYDYAIRP